MEYLNWVVIILSRFFYNTLAPELVSWESVVFSCFGESSTFAFLCILLVLANYSYIAFVVSIANFDFIMNDLDIEIVVPASYWSISFRKYQLDTNVKCGEEASRREARNDRIYTGRRYYAGVTYYFNNLDASSIHSFTRDLRLSRRDLRRGKLNARRRAKGSLFRRP